MSGAYPDRPAVNRLSQVRWSDFCRQINEAVSAMAELDGAEIHGRWMSLPDAPRQNACWGMTIPDVRVADMERFRAKLAAIGRAFDQDAVGWAAAPYTDFLS